MVMSLIVSGLGTLVYEANNLIDCCEKTKGAYWKSRKPSSAAKKAVDRMTKDCRNIKDIRD